MVELGRGAVAVQTLKQKQQKINDRCQTHLHHLIIFLSSHFIYFLFFLYLFHSDQICNSLMLPGPV